ncbi:hypothetical protein B0O99DRAFT_621583 [Bisporella sp. PMI_857]|nr:hypothetical protein B0O99DRAFT_621583 [Bisporella sp. PMI_857]
MKEYRWDPTRLRLFCWGSLTRASHSPHLVFLFHFLYLHFLMGGKGKVDPLYCFFTLGHGMYHDLPLISSRGWVPFLFCSLLFCLIYIE